MNLKECTYGRMVISDDMKVGHVVGVAYNVRLSLTGGMSKQDLFDRTIAKVQFADGIQDIHPRHLSPFE
jgi:hypothetical protein